MTARPLRSTPRDLGFRVLDGRKVRRASIAPWLAVSVIAVMAFLGLVGARTALDKAAFDMASIDVALAEEVTLNQQLRVEIAELENPARVAPLAEELGLVIPGERRRLLVEGIERDDGISDPAFSAAGAGEPTS